MNKEEPGSYLPPSGAIPFRPINWEEIPGIEYPGERGTAWWQTIEYGGLRVRIVTYSPGYLADHWCTKGHIVHCLEGAFTTELSDGTTYDLGPGDSYIVSDHRSEHRSVTGEGAKLLIIDGDFLGKGAAV